MWPVNNTSVSATGRGGGVSGHEPSPLPVAPDSLLIVTVGLTVPFPDIVNPGTESMVSPLPEPKVKKLLIASHVTHYWYQGRTYADQAYVREIDVWADLFPQVDIVAPLRRQSPIPGCDAFSRRNICVRAVPETGGNNISAKLRQLFLLPVVICTLVHRMWRADAIHIRCPGSLGFLAAALAPLFSRRLIAKYAGAWEGYPGEAITWRFGRWLLRSRWWRGPITVYQKPRQHPNHVVPFFSSIMKTDEMERAKAVAGRRRFHSPLRVLYVGRLSKEKNVDVLLRAIAAIKRLRPEVRCSIVGDGPKRDDLHALRARLGLDAEVEFAGGLRFERVMDYYERSDVLVLVSRTEGWPKCLNEAMAFGLVCVGSEFLHYHLGEGRGRMVPSGDLAALTRVLSRLAADEQECLQISKCAAPWGQRYTLEDLKQALGTVMAAHWNPQG